MCGLNGTWAWLPQREQTTAKYSRGPPLPPSVAARTLAGIAHRAPAGSAARAAFGVRDEPLLRVVLLILGRVDELGAAVDTGQGSIDVGHVSPPGAAGSAPAVPGTGEPNPRPAPPRGAAGRLGRIRSTVFGSLVPVWDAPAGRQDTTRAGSRQNGRSGSSDRARRGPGASQPRCIGRRGTWHNRRVGLGPMPRAWLAGRASRSCGEPREHPRIGRELSGARAQ